MLKSSQSGQFVEASQLVEGPQVIKLEGSLENGDNGRIVSFY